MKVVRYPSKLSIRKSSLILGAFEVIHNGHLELIKKAQSFKEPVVIMVVKNPALLPKSTHKPATDLNVRLAQLANLGVDYAVVINMEDKMIMTEGRVFVENLVRLCSAVRIILGRDFKTGYNANYKAQTIKSEFPSTIIVDFLKANSTKISTSIVKELLEVGAVAKVAEISPFPFQRTIAFDKQKTATNTTYLAIHPGIYACYCEVNDVIYWALLRISIKNKLTIHVPDLLIEKKPFQAKIWFHKRIRPIVNATDERITKDDIAITTTYLKSL